ncbi:protein dj-1beta [Nilaparvata lugens]|uniref:protein dj-1beta n=1 Tax=Nilaparvata lugens TaxID=108931 RepID=UPI000B9868C3|nr:protein dj-1beta [Nilaparvata lugens]
MIMFKIQRLSTSLSRLTSVEFSTYFNNMAKKSAAVIIAEGTEDMEFAVSVDVLRRAEIDVSIVSLENADSVKLKTGTKVVPDTVLKSIAGKCFDAVVLPGGPAYKALSKAPAVGDILKEQEKSGRLIAAICAAPIVLSTFDVGSGKKITCYPTCKDELNKDKYSFVNEIVAEDGNIITSQGPGTAYDFALAVVAKLLGKPTAKKVAEEMLYKYV